ncbi:MAG: M23 family metallopeptidase [Clostridia bacterium]|nr:M23 family metallopeptidase [Clostridia bacterium]
MEQVYRRRSSESSARLRYTGTKTPSPYKKTLVKQSVFCLLVFAFCLFVKVTPNRALLPAKNSINLIINTKTDLTKIPGQIQSFFTSLTAKDTESNLGDKELLTRLVKPVEAPLTSPFGLRTDPENNEEAFHYGVDLGAPMGEKIKCAAEGEATEVGENAEYGNYIVVRHSETVYTLYAHCQEVLPKTGDAITAGQVIATVGDTGNATGPHLHFEIRDGETWLDPAKFLELS